LGNWKGSKKVGQLQEKVNFCLFLVNCFWGGKKRIEKRTQWNENFKAILGKRLQTNRL
jgi:hypothetical protein